MFLHSIIKHATWLTPNPRVAQYKPDFMDLKNEKQKDQEIEWACLWNGTAKRQESVG